MPKRLHFLFHSFLFRVSALRGCSVGLITSFLYVLTGETITIKSRLWPSWWLNAYNKLFKWTVSSFLLVSIKYIDSNKTIQSSHKCVFTLAPSVTSAVISRGLFLYAKCKPEIPFKFLFLLFKSSQCIHSCWSGIKIPTAMAVKLPN